MDSPQFKIAYKNLNPEQKKAVDTIEGPVMVVAGPGTGKTQILTLRIANILLHTQVSAGNILALTFTESAAREMRKRLVDLIGTPGYKVEIATFHGFCNEIIQSYPEDFPHLISSKPIIEVEQIQIIKDILASNQFLYLKPMGDPLYYVRSLLSEINNLKKEGVTVALLEEAIKIQEEDFLKLDDLYHDKGKYQGEMKGKYQDLQRDIAKNKELSVVYKEYQKALNEGKYYDFNDMLLEVNEALSANKSLLLRLQERYQYFLVDEHQDTNAAQNKIIERLASFFDQPNLFVVGDEKQAIFRFQGASLENFLYFRSLYPDAELISLKHNYRSHQTILDAADSLIVNNLTANLLLPEKVKLEASSLIKIPIEKIKLIVLNDFFAEYQFIAEDIKTKIKNGVTPSQITVIARNNKDLSFMSDTLQRENISYAIHADNNVLSDTYIKKLLIILNTIENIGSELDLLSAMHVDLFNIDHLDIYKILSFARKNQISVWDFVDELNEEKAKELNLKSFESIKDFYLKIKDWQKLNRNDGFEHLFVTVVKESNLRAQILKDQRRYEVLDKLISLFEETKTLVERNPEFSLKDFLSHIDLCRENNIAITSKSQTFLENSINLMTAHRSKGLEFEYVYIINSFDGHWGNSKIRNRGFNIPWDLLNIKLNLKNNEDEKINETLLENEDERRLFYVAMTRAKKEILISYSTKSMDSKEQLPSQFIQEIDDRLKQLVDTDKFESEFIKSKDKLLDVNIEEKIPADNKEFFQKLFQERGLSPTGLDNYLKCPWTYLYRNLLLFPDAKTNSLIFGTAIHKALDSYIKALQQKKASIETVIQIYNDNINSQNISKLDRQALIEKGEKVLKGFYEQTMKNWKDNISSEMAVKGVYLSDGVILNGRLDMLEPTSNKDEFIVHDFKTGKPKSRNQISGLTESSDINYLRQLTFYKLLLDRYQNGKMKMVKGVIDFVEPDDKGRFKSEEFEISDQEVKVLEDQIKFVADEIINLKFWNRVCDDKECEYCVLRELLQ